MAVVSEHIDAERLGGAATRVIGALEAAGHEAWVVGGWVRDAYLGIPSHDIDLTCSARWEESERALRAAGITCERTGVAHGTVTAYVDGEGIEVTTFRRDGAYTDGRHPDEVVFVDDVTEDLARRDLTINAMAWHPERGLLDPFGGHADLVAGVVRTVGDPKVRFGEDALRILRAVRFATRLGFACDDATASALRTQAPLVSRLAPERAGIELAALVGTGCAARALMDFPEVMCAAIPELSACVGFDQRSVYHIYDVYEHIAHVCAAAEAFTAGCASRALRWAALLHDVAKPATFSLDAAGHGHFFCHPAEGARMAREIMGRLALGRELIEQVCCLIRLHDERIAPTAPAMRHWLADIATECPDDVVPLAFQLLDLCRSDAVSKSPAVASWAHELDRYSQVLRAEVAAGPVFEVRHLKVGGDDVCRACGIRRGPGVGMVLRQLLVAVMAGEVANERAELLSWLSA